MPEASAKPPSGFRHELAMEQMRLNCKRDLPWFVGSNVGNGNAFVIVAGGPSLRSRLGAIRARQKRGACVFACNGAARLLIQHGIKPDLIGFVDIGPAVTGFIPEAGGEELYLVSSGVNPAVLDALEGRKVVLWHVDHGEGRNQEAVSILYEYPEKPGCLIGGGNTIAMRAQNLGYLLGFRDIHYYGLDSSYAADGADHAYTKHDGTEPEHGIVTYDGVDYRCSPWMAKQADEFPFYFNQMRQCGVRLFVHGEGLIAHIWRNIRRAPLRQMALAA